MKDVLDNHRSLMILEELSKGGAPTQRDLSVNLGIALGLVNTYLKVLVKKGHIKISGIPPKRFKYYLTPKGFIEKSRLTYSLLQRYTRLFREAREDYSRVFAGLSAAGVREVYFAGLDDLAEIAFLSLRESGIELAGAVDDALAGGRFLGVGVTAFDALEPGDTRQFVITAYAKDGITARLAGAGVSAGCVHGI